MKDYLEMIRVLPTATKAVMAAGLVFAASAVGYLMFLTIVNGAAESSSRSEGKFNRLVIGLAVLVVAGIASRVWKRFRHED